MKRRALIADVDPLARKCLEEVLTDFNFDIAITHDDESAYQRFVDFGPDVVFVDTLLPRKGAFELIRRIRQTESGDRVSVFVTSAIRGGAIREESISVWGALGFLTKPLEAERLREQIGPQLGIEDDADAADGGAKVDEFPDQGEFKRSNFSKLFASMLKRKAPTRLAVGVGKIRKAVHFEGGNITFGRSNLLAETLARHLLEHETVTEEQYRQGIAIAVEKKRLIGEAFVSIGAVTQQQVDEGIRDNILEKIQNLFTWQNGWYKVVPYTEPPAGIPGGAVDGWSFLWDEVKERMDQTLISEELTPLANQVMVKGDGIELGGFDDISEKDLAKVMKASIDRPVVEACEDVGTRRLQLFYFLILTGNLILEDYEDEKGKEEVTAESKHYDELSNRLAWMRGRNFFQILGVSTVCTTDEVSISYEKLKGELGCEGYDSETALGALVEEACELVEKAFEVLSITKAREDYLEALSHGGEIPVQGEDRAKRAEASYREGMAAMRMHRWDEAVDRLGWAVDLSPEEPEYLLRLADARLSRESSNKNIDLAQAETGIRKVLDMDEKNPEAYCLLGRVYGERGDMKQAKDYIGQALSIKPGHKSATLALKKLGEKGGSRFSLFGKRK